MSMHGFCKRPSPFFGPQSFSPRSSLDRGVRLGQARKCEVVLHVHGQAPTMAIGNMSIPDDVRLPTCEHF